MKKYFINFFLLFVFLTSLLSLSSCNNSKTEGLIFVKLDDGNYSVSLSDDYEYENIVIPKKHKNKDVTTISDFGFSSKKIKNLTIPSSITKIEKHAFFNTSIENLYIESYDHWFSIDFVSEYSNPMYETKNFYVRNQKTDTHRLIIPEGIERITKYSLMGKHISLELPSTIKEIEDCSILSTIEIINHSSVHLNQDSDALIESLFTILEIHSGPSKLDFVGDYVFYKKDDDFYLVKYIGSDFNVVLPDSYQGKGYIIYDYAFMYNTNLISIILPNSVMGFYPNSYPGYVFEIVNNSQLNYNDIPLHSFVMHNGESRLEKNGDFWFYKDKNGYHLVRYIGDDKNLTLPEYFNNENYTIASGAFASNDIVKTIHIPKTVYDIQSQAFGNSIEFFSVDVDNPAFKSINGNLYSSDEKCLIKYASGKNDTHFIVPNNVAKICDGAFQGSIHLKSVTLSQSVESIGTFAFSYCYNLEEIIFSNSLKSIEWLAFIYCISLKKIDLPEGLTTIYSSAFEYCINLEEVNIPSTLESLSSWAFSDCYSLKSINVHTDNKEYKDIDGNLYSKDGKELISYAPNNSAPHFEVPNGVTSIASLAFSNCNNLKSVIIPKTLTRTSGTNIFRDSSVENIYYLGTKEDWSSIDLYDRDKIEELNIYFYSYNKPTENGLYWHYNSYRIPIPWN